MEEEEEEEGEEENEKEEEQGVQVNGNNLSVRYERLYNSTAGGSGGENITSNTDSKASFHNTSTAAGPRRFRHEPFQRYKNNVNPLAKIHKYNSPSACGVKCTTDDTEADD